MVGHQHVGDKSDAGVACESLDEDAFEGLVVGGFMEDRVAGIAAIEHVIDQPAEVDTMRSAHHINGVSPARSVKKVPDTFSHPTYSTSPVICIPMLLTRPSRKIM